jgi:hypothetical protein
MFQRTDLLSARRRRHTRPGIPRPPGSPVLFHKSTISGRLCEAAVSGRAALSFSRLGAYATLRRCRSFDSTGEW